MLIRKLGLTASQAQCFELGNFLRDVSQFRDPYAFQLKKLDIYRTKVRPKIPKEFAPDWRALLDEIFGPNPRYDKDPSLVAGALGEWFRNMVLAGGLASFSSSFFGLPRTDLIPEADFQRLFTQYFTQYYPHEHLDFPPTGDLKFLGDWSKVSDRPQGVGDPGRRVLAYLDGFIDYIAAQFLQAEIDLKSLLSVRQSPAKIDPAWNETLQKSLVGLGKASHAVEDYYFHSNFAELAFLPENIGLPAFYSVPGVGSVPPVGSLIESEKRRMFRRARAPRLAADKDGNSVLDTSSSEYARRIFTGMFGGDDVLYTFGDAFESFASWGFRDLFVQTLDSTLFKHLLDSNPRKELVTTTASISVTNDAKIDEVNKKHIQELMAEKLVKKAREHAPIFGMGPLFTASIMRANQVDLDIALESVLSRGIFRILNVFQDFCIGKVLIYLAATVEAAEQNGRRTADNMDKVPRDIYYLASNNTNTAENIGSHTLMAKDSEHKQPLRKATDNFARFAVATVMNRLASQVASPGQANKYVDWGELLRRLLCHPAQAPSDWPKKILAGEVVPPGTFEPQFISRQQAEKALLDGAKRTAALEQSYHNLYLEAAALWKKEVQ